MPCRNDFGVITENKIASPTGMMAISIQHFHNSESPTGMAFRIIYDEKSIS